MGKSLARISRISKVCREASLTLTRFKARIGLIDHIKTTFAAYDAAVFVPLFQRLKGAADFHGTGLSVFVYGSQ